MTIDNSLQFKQVDPDDISVIKKLFKRNQEYQDDLSTQEREKRGTHYTNIDQILKIVYPVVILPLEKEWEEAKSAGKIAQFFDRLASYRVLDPACGCGNFLIISFYMLVKFERMVRKEAEELWAIVPEKHLITANNFYGIEINAGAVDMCKSNLEVCEMCWVVQPHIVVQ